MNKKVQMVDKKLEIRSFIGVNTGNNEEAAGLRQPLDFGTSPKGRTDYTCRTGLPSM